VLVQTTFKMGSITSVGRLSRCNLCCLIDTVFAETFDVNAVT
jgi:hypothetical protein